ncbi:hypothetical protein G8V07_11530 [Clostridium botulinum D/C]|uniref:hypothetical protein n=1 Tax=Clostridium botulinum TaxID=1491 RepID=UPI001E49BF87|nr:hypothetical protein [Clostridium botulinum]MCD3319514.1 hypothetical protein [Clostridium botulinum D/C]MCD3324379.1 hypothetical protein [Clostridium botulinum D/C]MCD3327829.1 hypothetical protein [Clostridium botulinum D/C]
MLDIKVISVKDKIQWKVNSDNINTIMEEVVKSGNTGSNVVLIISKDSDKKEIFNFGKMWGKALRSPYFYINETPVTMEKYEHYRECCQLCKTYQKEKRIPTEEELKDLNVYQVYILGRLCWDL